MAEKAFERAEEAAITGHPANEIEAPQYQGSQDSASTAHDRDNEERGSKDLTRVQSGISIEQGEAEFAGLQREFTGISRASRRSNKNATDPEKGPAESGTSDDGSLFDLETALRGDLDASQGAGIKAKHIGAYWDGLTVKGIGGMTNYVKTFPDAFVDFFNVITPVVNMLGLGPKPTEATLLNGFQGVCKVRDTKAPAT